MKSLNMENYQYGKNEDERKFAKDIANDADTPPGEHDEAKVNKDLVIENLNKYKTTHDKLNQLKVHQTVEKFMDTIDAFDMQLDYQVEKFAEFFAEVRELKTKQKELTYIQKEGHFNVVAEMNRIADRLHELEVKYEHMANKAEENSKYLVHMADIVSTYLSHSYSIEIAYDKEGNEVKVPNDRTYLKN